MSRLASARAFALAALIALPAAGAAADVLWSSAAGSAWLTGGNWTGGAVPSTTDVAQFGVNPTSAATGVGINMNGATNNGANNQAVGAVSVLNTRTNNFLLGNSSGVAAGTLTLTGATVNGVANTVLANFAQNAATVTVQNTQGSGAQTMTVALPNPTNVVQLGAGTAAAYGNAIIVTSNVTNAEAGFTVLGGGTAVVNPGTLSLGGAANTFGTGITVGNAAGNNAGRLTFTTAGAMPPSGTITVHPNSQLLLNTALAFTPTTTLSLNSTGTAQDNGGIRANANVTLSNSVTVAGNSAVFVNTGNSLTFQGPVSGSSQLSKTGTGTLVLSASSAAYSGLTQVDGGTVLANATQATGTGPVSVNSSGTLGGTGSATGAISVSSGGTIRPGNAAGVGTLTAGNTLVQSGGTVDIVLAAGGVSNSLAHGTSSLTLASGSRINISGFVATTAATYTIGTFTNAATSFFVGAANPADGVPISTLTVGTGSTGPVVLQGAAGYATGDMFTLQRQGNNAVLIFTPVPEPALVFAALLLGGAATARWRRHVVTV